MKRTHIVITGCSRGIGRALVDRFIERDWFVSGCARNESIVTELNQQYGGNTSGNESSFFETLDVKNANAVEQWTSRVLDRNGPPDILFNSAAIINKNALLWNVPQQEFEDVIHTNVVGVFTVCKAFLPAMVERGTGVILNISSGWGLSSSPEVGPYCASKHAVEGLTKSLAQEIPPGMAAIPLSPGVINTEMLQSCLKEHAHEHPDPTQWSHDVINDIIYLGPEQNGMSLRVPLSHDWDDGES